MKTGVSETDLIDLLMDPERRRSAMEGARRRIAERAAEPNRTAEMLATAEALDKIGRAIRSLELGIELVATTQRANQAAVQERLKLVNQKIDMLHAAVCEVRNQTAPPHDAGMPPDLRCHPFEKAKSTPPVEAAKVGVGPVERVDTDRVRVRAYTVEGETPKEVMDALWDILAVAQPKPTADLPGSHC